MTTMTEVKERPILFSRPMVRAILDGEKTQTRRVVKPQPEHPHFYKRHMLATDDEGVDLYLHSATLARAIRCPYGKPVDRLWVREAWQGPLFNADQMDTYQSNRSAFETPAYCRYAADGGGPPEFFDADDNLQHRWRPSIHMPRWASRITLEVTDVRIERLHDISEADALAEGIGLNESALDVELTKPAPTSLAISMYRDLWESINGPGSWADNPWVWVIEFKTL